MVELFQTAWCPRSEQIRRRLADVGLDFVVRWVPDDPAERDALEEATGERTVPVLMFEDGLVLAGIEQIVGYLAELRSDECDSTPSSRERESLLAGVPMS